MTAAAAVLHELDEAVAGLAPARRRRLIAELNDMQTGDDNQRPDIPGQLSLFNLKTLVEADDTLKTATLKDIADTYGINPESLKRYVRSGQLKAVRFGRRYHVTIAELKRFLDTPRLNAQPRARARKDA